MIYTNNLLIVDDSTKNNGVIKVNTTEKTKTKIKIGVTKNNTTLYYDLINPPIQIPLQLGAGTYTISLYINIAGTRYKQNGEIFINAKKIDSNAYMLTSNQYIECEKAKDFADKIGNTFQDVRNYLKRYCIYDFIKAINITKGQLPDITTCINTRKGICQDFAALATAILRLKGIPARMVVGTADKRIHAWVEVNFVNSVNSFFELNSPYDKSIRS